MSKVISKIVVPDSSELTGYALYNVKDANAIPASEKGAASGVATLDNTGKIPSSQIPSSIVSLLSDWNQTDSTAGDYIKNKPTIPSVGNAEIEIQKNGTKVGSFTTNQSGSKVTMNITVPTGTAANKDVPTSGNASTSQVVMGNDSRLTDSRNAKDVYSWAKASSKPTYTASEVGAISTSAKGAANGVAQLDSTGKVPSSQLPSYVDDVLEYESKISFPATGETGKIYIDKATNLTWRWGGSNYIEISPSLALGETSSTAYAGDKGKALADKLATIASGAEVNVQSDWNATSGDAFIKNKPTIPTVNNATFTIQKNGTTVKTFTANASSDVTANITVPTKVSELTNDSGYTTNTGTITGIKMNNVSKGTSGVVDLGTVITSHQDISGKLNKSGDTMTGDLTRKCTNVDASKANNNISSTIYPTTYNVIDNNNRILTRKEAIIESNGNISAYWYVRNYNTSGTMLGQKGIKITMDKSGNATYTVDEAAKFRSAIGAGTSSFSGSYNDLSNKPTIPADANNGTYTVKTLVGSTTTNVSDFTANQSSADDVTFVQGSNVTITPDAANRKITIAAKDTTYSPQSLGNGIGTCSTSSGTALVVTLSGYNLVKNGFVAVTFENDVPANATLNINGKGAKPIIYKGSAIEADTIKADDTVMFCYNGSQYVVTSLGAGGSAPVNPNETVNISLTQVGGSSADLIGAAVTITDDDSGDTLLTAIWNGSTITTEIDVNTNYTVSVETIAGYLVCAPQSYQAGYQTTRNITFQYRALGAFVEATDGTLYTASTWTSSGKTANAVLIITSEHKYRIALNEVNRPIHKNYTDPIENYLPRVAEDVVAFDFNGEINTDKIIQFNAAYGTNTTSYAAPYCKNYTFSYPNNQHGFMPSVGQLLFIYNNKTAINQCMDACGGDEVFTQNYYQSSNYKAIHPGIPNDRCCYIMDKNGADYETMHHGINSNYRIRPISDYE